jgi:hypothetical protein
MPEREARLRPVRLVSPKRLREGGGATDFTANMDERLRRLIDKISRAPPKTKTPLRQRASQGRRFSFAPPSGATADQPSLFALRPGKQERRAVRRRSARAELCRDKNEPVGDSRRRRVSGDRGSLEFPACTLELLQAKQVRI